MDEVNKSGPYFEAVSLCYFNGSDSLWRWTRVADIENGELTTFWYNPLRSQKINKIFFGEHELFPYFHLESGLKSAGI